MRLTRALGSLAVLGTLSACSGGSSSPGLSPEALTGRQVFTRRAMPSCAGCHRLRDAGSTGKVGPDLDELKPDRDGVRTAVVGGVGLMPSQANVLTTEEIDAVAQYLVEVAGRE